jgi:hypothetical protein
MGVAKTATATSAGSRGPTSRVLMYGAAAVVVLGAAVVWGSHELAGGTVVGFHLWQLSVIAAIMCVSGLMSGLSGFGFSAVGSLCLLFLPPKLAVPLLMALSTANQMMSLGQIREDLPKTWAEAWPGGSAPYIQRRWRRGEWDGCRVYRRDDWWVYGVSGSGGGGVDGAEEPAEEGFAGDRAAVHPGVAGCFVGDECLYASRDFWTAVLAAAGDYAAGGVAGDVWGRGAVQADIGCELQEDHVYFAGAFGGGTTGEGVAEVRRGLLYPFQTDLLQHRVPTAFCTMASRAKRP